MFTATVKARTRDVGGRSVRRLQKQNNPGIRVVSNHLKCTFLNFVQQLDQLRVRNGVFAQPIYVRFDLNDCSRRLKCMERN